MCSHYLLHNHRILRPIIQSHASGLIQGHILAVQLRLLRSLNILARRLFKHGIKHVLVKVNTLVVTLILCLNWTSHNLVLASMQGVLHRVVTRHLTFDVVQVKGAAFHSCPVALIR